MSITTVRASSWAALFDCAYKWEGANLLGMRKPSGLRALLGTAIHASTAVFDQARVNHEDVRPDDAAGVLVDTIAKPAFDVDWSQDDLSKGDATRIGLALHSKYCLEVSPRFSFVAVEMQTKPLDIDCGGGVVVRITGTMDRCRIKKATGGIGIQDLKSGVQAVQKGEAKTKGHSAQIGTYEMLTQHTLGEEITEPADIIGLKTSGTPEVAVGQIRHARRVMVGDDQHQGLIHFAADMFHSGLFPPNPQSLLCSEKYCARWHKCPYHE